MKNETRKLALNVVKYAGEGRLTQIATALQKAAPALGVKIGFDTRKIPAERAYDVGALLDWMQAVDPKDAVAVAQVQSIADAVTARVNSKR